MVRLSMEAPNNVPFELLVLLDDVCTDNKPKSRVKRNNQGSFDGTPWKEQLRELWCYVLPACVADLLTGRSMEVPNLWTSTTPLDIREEFAHLAIVQAEVYGRARPGFEWEMLTRSPPSAYCSVGPLPEG